MICFPNCKINIGLNVVKKRDDGFHNIETVFYPVGLCDALEIMQSNDLEIEVSGIKIGGNPKSNLCLKAYHIIADEYKIPNVKIFLHKAIPSDAGLGGGSSDAAFTLKLLNSYFNLNIPEEKMLRFALALGSDCTFFIRNTTAFAHERGNIMKESSLDLKGYHVLIVKPDFGISTTKAYTMITPASPVHSLKKLKKENIHKWKNTVVNDFEIPVSKKFPSLLKIKEELYKAGAIYASMSGSGSALYGIFEKEPEVPVTFRKYFTWKGVL